MIKSIRSKLFISITFLLIFFVFLLWMLNNLYLEQYYVDKKKSILRDNAKHLANIYKGNIKDIQNELDITASITGSNIDIRSSDGILLYSSFRKPPEDKHIMNNDKLNSESKPFPDKPHDNEVTQYTEGNDTFEIRRDTGMNIDFLALGTKLNNGDILTIRIPIVSIRESVDIANRFIIITGIIIIMFGSLWVYIFSRRFTKPILEVNKIARNMAKFDFTAKCNINGKDEIGQLGQSVNYLSGELDRAITELNIKNKKLEEDIEKERKIDEMRKEFISSVSHELRTPLSIIQGYAEGLNSNIAENIEDRKFYCDVIMNETEKMNKLVRDLLNLSQIESGYFHIEKSEFNLTELIKYVLNKYQSIFKEKNIEVNFESCENINVYGDMVRIEQVLTNYLNNAINHIDIDRVIKIKNICSDDKVRVIVFNTGKHIPSESLGKLWNSFYKVDKARTRAYGGYGLGLSIVKAIQDLHKNSYGVENSEGGVTFWFEIDKVKDTNM
ncbi:HAMP domain-containing histidine kinase [Clostridiaceae bacterium UIB06]|uniref:histidine kinase n=1 Tax=Clostridium thailandense TaxID=2794346 RepID=A0A949X3K4_9CLOT|nr:HAMP domain-containing sensor histidine kinase [Clostridium thailandense]MBV7274774.1 HAMP domain-containing histidine kinase [Clostridium thailandense]MCH5137235.1 HAMP domain-containing histidine kinase [Clostridiaceae bacterium UIB06]